jgi:hypothetical protein
MIGIAARDEHAGATSRNRIASTSTSTFTRPSRSSRRAVCGK